MNRSHFERTSQNLATLAGVRSGPAQSVAAPRPADCFGGASAFQKREIARRARILSRFTDLTKWGLNQGDASKLLGVGYTTIWRWRKNGIVPATYKCGRKASISELGIPPWIVSAIQKLQGAGVGNQTAWRILVSDPRCPDELRNFVDGKRTLPPSLLELTRVQRQKVTKISGNNFTVILE
jgi:hypothetical protein